MSDKVEHVFEKLANENEKTVEKLIPKDQYQKIQGTSGAVLGLGAGLLSRYATKKPGKASIPKRFGPAVFGTGAGYLFGSKVLGSDANYKKFRNDLAKDVKKNPDYKKQVEQISNN